MISLPSFRYTELLPVCSGRNTPFVAEVDPRTEFPAAVAAQEIAESRRKLVYGGSIIVAGAIVGILVGGLWTLASNFVAAAVLVMLFRTPWGIRRLELYGHEVEVEAAVMLYGQDRPNYRQSQAKEMQSYTRYPFGAWTIKQVREGMEANHKAARRFVVNNLTRLRQIKDETQSKGT